MTADHLEQALRACSPSPVPGVFRRIQRGGQLFVSHPEAIRREGALFIGRVSDGTYQVFPADNVSRLVEMSSAKFD